MFLFFLSSGLFLGWALGANDASNVFGSAVGSKMIRFKQAAILASIFVILGALLQGYGGANTLGKLGGVDALGGAFTVALAAALSVYWMTRLQLPVSTSQAIVGAIVGWNFFTHNPTDYHSLIKIVITWITGPILGGIFAVLLFLLLKFILVKIKVHLVLLDAFIKYGLLVVGAFGAYSLGANNIANVVGVFVPSAPNIALNFGLFSLNGVQLLFLTGGIAIAIGIISYSKRVMLTVGNSLMKLNAETALIVVLAHSLVLFLFSSQGISDFFAGLGLPAIPLVPVSSSQVIIGSILGIGILKGGRNIHLRTIGKIASGWVITPISSWLMAFILLFFMSNVFNLKVSQNPSIYVKGDVIENVENHDTDDTETKVIDNINTKKEPLISLNLYKPFVIICITLLTIVIIYQYYKFLKIRDKNKEKEYVENLERYDRQHQVLINELDSTKNVKLKLEKEIKSKEKEQKKIALSIIRKNNILSNLKNEIEKLKQKPEGELKYSDLNTLKLLIIESLNIENERKSFHKYIEDLNSTFYKNLEKKYPGLTPNEKRLCSLLRLDLTSKEMASILNLSPKSVEINRYRLRKKMQIKKNQKLSKIIRKL